MDFTCRNSPSVWDGNGFSACFSNLVFGFCGNMCTILVVLYVAVARRNDERASNMRVCCLEKTFWHLIPACGACLTFFELVLLLRNGLQGQSSENHELFSAFSQFASWMVILLALNVRNGFRLLCHPILCIWWVVKPMLEIPHLWVSFSTYEISRLVCQGMCIFVEILFCLFVNIVRVVHAPNKERIVVCSLEDPLLEPSKEEKGCAGKLIGWIGCLWDLLTFRFVNQMMDTGQRKQLNFEDLVKLPYELQSTSCHSTLASCWVAERDEHGASPSLFKAISYAYGWAYLRLGLLKVLNDSVGFFGPLLLNRLILYLQEGSTDIDGYILAISMGLASAIKSFLDTQYSFHLMKLKLKLRSAIMTMIYWKCVCTSLAGRSNFSEGEVQTFMSVDADRTVNLCNSFHDMWSLPLQIGVALYLLYTQVQFAFVSGVAITILLIPVNKWISTLIATATGNMMKQKDERVRRTGELLSHIRTLKLYSWEDIFTSRLMEIRDKEVKYLSSRKYLDAWCVFFWATTPILFSLFTFGVFTLMGHSLDAATVFTCLALFNTLISPLNSFPWVINGLIDAVISTRRLSKFLSCPERSCNSGEYSALCSTCLVSDGDTDSLAVVCQDASSTWSSSYEGGQSTVLSGISVNIPKAILVAIVGEIGSGKSSLLSSILGELFIFNGSIFSSGSTAYVPQVPWILSGSVRENILFGSKLNATRYSEVLHACALDVDISRMIGGDLAHVGEKGLNLSGGQRARLALARAMYQDSDIYLLDDVLSAVDSQVACWILQKGIVGPLMDQKTRLLCTHNLQAISAADMIIVMEKGRVKWTGDPSSFALSPCFSISIEDQNLALLKPIIRDEASFLVGDSPSSSSDLKSYDQESEQIAEDIRDVTGTELRKEGRIEMIVYKHYAMFISFPIVILICVSAILMQASRNGNDLWLSHWVDSATGTERTRFYLGILVIFGCANSLLTLVRSFSFSYGGLRAAVQAHNELLSKLVNAPVQYFDQNPTGRILNRFSSDLYMIDDSLPFILNILLANFLSLLGIAVVLCCTQILFLLVLCPLLYIYSKIQFYYRCTSRELRRLDSVSRSPIYSSFTETLDGSTTIRAFKLQDWFMSRFFDQLTLYQQTSYAESTASLWLSLRLQLLAALIVSFLALMAIIGSPADFAINFTTPGLVGLALSYAAPIVSLLSNFLTSFTETEKEMVSIERVLQYMDVPQEESHVYQSASPDWPMHGKIVFEHVVLKYFPLLPPALNDVSFRIAGGMQVGIVGRTGAGKSSILNALFRLAPICDGYIFVDGLDIANISVRTLRERFAVVPQSPFLFEGTLRDNLDPSGRTNDVNIWQALEKCHVKSEVERAGGLDVFIKESHLSFSVGQRQLLCLARALIRSSKILCLDECTANIDTQTATLLQKAISSECNGMTVLTIAHRISVILNMDLILVFDHGCLVEQGNPEVLLRDPSSKFSHFARASLM